MDENKQIEEMEIFAQGIKYSIQDEEDKRYRYLTQLDKQSAKEISEKFYNAGYRRQSDTAKEILDEVSRHFGGAWLVELYKKYGVEVEE